MTTIPAAAVGGSVLVGRDRELHELYEALIAARQGRGSLTVVSGEPGAGKTRLLNEARSLASAAPMATLWGTGTEHGSAIPLLPVAEAVNNLLDTLDLASLRKRLGTSAQLLGGIAPRLSDSPIALAGEGAAAAVLESVALLLREVAAPAGALLVLDDAHWADPSTLGLLEYLARRAPGFGIAILVGWRDAPGLASSERLERLPGVRHLALEPLGLPAVAALATSILEQPASVQTVRLVSERSRGNPLAAEHLFRAVAAGTPLEALPLGLREAILGAAQHLGNEERAVAQAAAVVGESFDSITLSRITGLEPLRCREIGQTLRRLQLLDEGGGPDRYRFHHQLIQDAIYAETPEPVRRRLHSLVADELEIAGAPPAVVARHLWRCGREREAVAASIRGAEAAERLGGLQEAAGLFAQAALSAPESEAAILLGRAGVAAWQAGDIPRSIELLEQTVSALESQGRPGGFYRAYLAVAYGRANRAQESAVAVSVAVAELEPGGPSTDLAFALAMLGVHHAVRQRPEEAMVYGERALAMAQQLDDERDLVFAEGALAMALGALDRMDEAIARIDALRSRAAALGMFGSLAIGINNAGVLRQWTLRARECLADLELLERPPLSGAQLNGRQLQASVLALLGRPAEIAERAADWLSEFMQLGDTAHAEMVRSFQARALAELDRPEEARSLITAQPPARDYILITRNRVLTWLMLGDHGRAAEEAEDLLVASPSFYFRRFVGEPAVEAFLAADRRQAAEAVAAEIREQARDGDPYWDLIQARLALDNEPRYAAELAADAAAAFEAAEYLPDACRSRRLAAAGLLAAGDQSAAGGELRKSLAAARASGLQRELRLARERLAALGESSDLPSAEVVKDLLEHLEDSRMVGRELRARLVAAIDGLVAAGGREGEAGTILRDYYVKKVGSQEVVAERHYLTRPTFYRRLHLGWELLASRLGPLDGAPTGSARER